MPRKDGDFPLAIGAWLGFCGEPVWGVLEARRGSFHGETGEDSRGGHLASSRLPCFLGFLRPDSDGPPKAAQLRWLGWKRTCLPARDPLRAPGNNRCVQHIICGHL